MEQIAQSRLYPHIWEMIENKQCEDELDLIILFDSIFIAGAGVVMSEDEISRLKKK